MGTGLFSAYAYVLQEVEEKLIDRSIVRILMSNLKKRLVFYAEQSGGYCGVEGWEKREMLVKEYEVTVVR